MLRRAEAYLAAAVSSNPGHADAALVLPGHEHIYFFHGRTCAVCPNPFPFAKPGSLSHDFAATYASATSIRELSYRALRRALGLLVSVFAHTGSATDAQMAPAFLERSLAQVIVDPVC